jgi:FtsP/CotA-like multicopper oxidase with cupredoxin domain
MDRRNFLKLASTGLAGAAIGPLVHAPGWAQAGATAAPTALKAVKRTIEVNGKPASVFGLVRDNGARGVTLAAGQSFNVALTNELAEPTMIHWHGMTPPWPQDGVPDVPAPLIKPGETRSYSFPVKDPGTYWMHAQALQEQALLAAPLIVYGADDGGEDEQEVVVLLHDFSFTPPETLLARLKKGGATMAMKMGGMGGIDMSRMSDAEIAKRMAQMNGISSGQGMGGMDINDIAYDAYLANDRTLADPEITRVEAGGRVRLRIINGAAATAFTIDAGRLSAELIAVDGQDIQPMTYSQYPVVMGQRVDIRLTIPKEGGVFPILALRQGAPEQTGVILATTGVKIRKVATVAAGRGPIIDLELEALLAPAHPPAARPVDRAYSVILAGGDTASYAWRVYGGDALTVKKGQRVEITMNNRSMMMHPMHLHGHRFEVVGINGSAGPGALRDTVGVPPMSSVTIAFDADNPGKWAFHCQHLYHMATGMMSFVTYEGIG